MTGTPTAHGAFNFTATATDANGCVGSKVYDLTIDCPTITVNPSSLPNGIQGNAYNHPLSVSGGAAPYIFAVTSGAQPTGLTLNSDGTWSGTPSAANTFNFTVTATDNIGCTGSRAYSVVITSCPSTFTVNNTGDGGDAIPGDGVCDDGAGHCTLRAAIEESNTLGSCLPVTINFSVTLPATITLGSQLTVTRSVNISGPGADQLSVSGNDLVRVFNIGSGTVSVSGLSVVHSHVTSASSNNFGGGIFNSGTLTLTECSVAGNSATGGNGNFGGGIWNEVGHTLTLTRSTVSGNSISGGTGNHNGAGITNRGTLTIVNSTISGNTAPSSAIGGGIATDTGTLNIINSTIASNTAGEGGGFAVFSGSVSLKNTLVGDNTALFNNTDPDIHGSFTSNGNNLIENTSGASFTPQGSDITGQDPKLDPLGSYGGRTQTHRLQSNSQAIDAGDNCVFDASCDPSISSALTTDQRGTGYTRKADGNADGSGVVDIGAYEATNLPTISATSVTRQAGSPVSNSQIATVGDAVNGAGSVTVTVTSANPSNGVTISNIANNAGTVSADVIADCNASDTSFTLTATNSNGGTNTATLNASVTANTGPTLSYTNDSVATVGSKNFNPATGPADNGSVSTIAVHSQGSYTGTISVDNSTGVVSISNAQPGGSHGRRCG